MNFNERVVQIGDMLRKQEDDIVIIDNNYFSYSNAFIYICSSLRKILGENTNSNIIIGNISIHDNQPMVRSITQDKKTISHHSIFLSRICENNIFHWFWELTHEMVHVFLSLKDNKIESSKDCASFLEEGLAVYLSYYLYEDYFYNIKIESPLIPINDEYYIYAEELFKQLILLNEGDINFIKKVRRYNPSLKRLNKNNFKDINISSSLIQELCNNFNERKGI